MPSRRATIDLMNAARYFLPHLLALSTSSPFWHGQNTGLNWRWNEVQNIQSQWDEDGAPDTYFILNRNTHLIGLGDAPDFDIVIRIRYTVNANGIVVHDVDFRDDMCQD